AYARGGVSRVPGPPLPTGVQVVQQFTAALQSDKAEATQYLEEGCPCTDTRGNARDPLDLGAWVPGLEYVEFDEALTEDGTVVYARRQRGSTSVERYHVRHGRIADIQSW